MIASISRLEESVQILQWTNLRLSDTPLFGTDGIRGLVGDRLTAPLALQIGFWTGQVLKAQMGGGPVIVGQDSRNSSPMLAMALGSGLTAAGLDVWYLGLCPTPAVAYLTNTTAAIGGVMISASHNPPEDNGIKIFGATGTKLGKELQAEIETGIRGQRSCLASQPWGQYFHQPSLLENYATALQKSVQSPLQPSIAHHRSEKTLHSDPISDFVPLTDLNVVLDLAWGAATLMAPQVFAALGADVITLHARPDGNRINVNCGSTHLRHLQQAVVEHGAAIGFAFDGDADRVLAVDHRGRAICGDYILYLWGNYLKQLGQLPNGLIVTTVMANLGFERAWQHQGGRLVRTPVGDQHVQMEMEVQGAMLGGEQSGHILCRHYGLTGDGVLTALHLSQLIQTTGASLAELVDQSFQPYPQLLRNVRVDDRHKRCNWQQCDGLMQAIDRAKAAMGDRGRILVRASGTEPVIRVMVEAAEADLVEHWTENLVNAVVHHLVG